ncbi:hypothetical protein N7462_010948, partial [Penicillium macrosclerotiorum]|uniref:uncharacterized protein n=1 Tax=Penicillium macrosclerotiorum TaxID=303699 RepID=UPI002546826A
IPLNLFLISTMSFHESAVSIELEEGHRLKATLRHGDDEERDSELDLNDVIGNNNGEFVWGGENFKDSAENIEFHREGDDDVPVLRAVLYTIDGEGVSADINLAERITNQDGHLVFV